MKNLIRQTIKSCLFIFLIFLTSCYSANGLLREAKKENQQIVSDEIEGLWSNSNKDRPHFDLHRILKENITWDIERDTIKGTTIKLKKIDDQTIEVLKIKSDLIVDQFYLNGVFEMNSFVVDRNLKLFPFFPIYYVHLERKTVIGINNSDQLVVASGLNRSAMILVMAGGKNYKSITIHERIKL